MAVTPIELNSSQKGIEAVELPYVYVSSEVDPPGAVVKVSADPLNTIERRPDGLFAAPKFSSAQW